MVFFQAFANTGTFSLQMPDDCLGKLSFVDHSVWLLSLHLHQTGNALYGLIGSAALFYFLSTYGHHWVAITVDHVESWLILVSLFRLVQKLGCSFSCLRSTRRKLSWWECWRGPWVRQCVVARMLPLHRSTHTKECLLPNPQKVSQSQSQRNKFY